MNTKKAILQLHKILGLATGIIVFIVAITGCCWVFKDEIQNAFNISKKIPLENKKIITVTKAKQIAQTIFPNNTVHGTVYKKKNDAIEVIFYDEKPEFYKSVFLHPYSGDILNINDHTTGFFALVLKGHMRLWLPKEIGEQVVGISILIFLFILISGFILWLPKKKKNLKQRLKFDWKKTTKWKRKNFDLHSITGFYILGFAFLIAFTGSVMSYDWLKYAVYKTSGGEKTTFFEIPNNKTNFTLQKNTKKIDLLIPKLQNTFPNADSFELHYPEDKKQSIYVEISKTKGVYYDSDFLFFDQNTLERIPINAIYSAYNNASVPDKILRMNYDIHVGAIGGIFGKIIAFTISLLIASLPVTGILLWYGKNYKKKRKSIAA
ncbi:MAG: PepSY-associated TM helix domain-containing protein [Polaribacter sp.]|uniref:PepSY-associated TM helix domain-containing protein n=1 Tax=Polaribacter sp. TaxID=1920175 RepID=UPI003219DB80